MNGKNITLSGTITDQPRRFEGNGGQYVSYSFKITSGKGNFGDEYIMVSFQTVKWGKKVGEFTHYKGEQVTLTGRYSESRSKAKGGLIGTLYVNDLDLKIVKAMP
jgi:DNA/RNA endonuclease YhcR with UshA esterase domain